jgi:nucleotide-binding universal stress UspA family protein
VAETIAHYARKLQADQVVMSSHGRGAPTHMLLGSVASDVIQRVDTVVSLVK